MSSLVLPRVIFGEKRFETSSSIGSYSTNECDEEVFALLASAWPSSSLKEQAFSTVMFASVYGSMGVLYPCTVEYLGVRDG